MDFGSIAVSVLRLVIPVSILRYPLGGIVASIALDAFDTPLVDIIGRQGGLFGGGFIEYHHLDKWLDLYYLFFAFLVSLRWQNILARQTASFLFFIRFLGVSLFSFTNFRALLFFFPNIFEMFFIYYLISNKWFPRFSPNSFSKLLIILPILAAPKFGIEYLLHVKQLKLMEIITLLTPLKSEALTVWEWLKTIFLKP